ncbi:MAG: alpha/beta fold hydrolase [Rubrivivax sp.]|jgi:magnesium chelatase accessory protein|nr:alpha/beta fold hydrolase [Rubrivivax sp.]
MTRPLDWAIDGAHWPWRDASRFVDAGGLRWHVQRGIPGAGRPRLLLVHGTGASTHTWRALWPLVATRFEPLAMDLPGHAFSSAPAPQRLALPAMAQSVAALLEALDFRPHLALGHSAGAAIVARMALDGQLDGAGLAAINGAYLPYGGLAAPLFTPLARALHGAGWVARLFARRAADPAVVRRLVEGTGSRLDGDGLALYGRLMTSPAHAAAALGMMAHWDLRALARELPALPAPLHLLVGAADRATPPRQARRVAALRPGSTVEVVPRAGHLVHEEDAAAVARWLVGLPCASPAPRV